jgi:hypothetical protein
MFSPILEGRKLTFRSEDGVIIDVETGSEWDVFGRAVDGEMRGAELEPILAHPFFWFAWSAFRPDTLVYGQ